MLQDEQHFRPGRKRAVVLPLVAVDGPDELHFFQRQFAVLDAFGERLAVFLAASGDAAQPAFGTLATVAALAALGISPARLPGLAWVGYLSTTGAYGDRQGAWVDEDSPTEPTHFSGVRMLEAERLVAAAGGVSLRLGGIYGPGRTRLIDAVRAGRASIRPGPPHWTNRIHRDDAAGALRHLIERSLAGAALAPVYVGVDDEPADEAEVLRWLAARLGLPEPPVAPSAARPPGRPRGGNKRCRNARLRASGYAFAYPTFREGYGALIDATRP